MKSVYIYSSSKVVCSIEQSSASGHIPPAPTLLSYWAELTILPAQLPNQPPTTSQAHVNSSYSRWLISSLVRVSFAPFDTLQLLTIALFVSCARDLHLFILWITNHSLPSLPRESAQGVIADKVGLPSISYPSCLNKAGVC
jgi:hypothetical protein